MDNREVDFLVVGQGIAGTILAHELRKENKSFIIIDDSHRGAASKVAAGIINPIIGKQFTLSWKIKEFLPVAIETYTELSQLFNEEVFKSHNLIRNIKDVEEENAWLSRSGDPDYIEFIVDKADVSEFNDILKPCFGFGEVKGSIQVNLPFIIDAYKNLLKSEKRYMEEAFIYDKLEINDIGFSYADISFNSIVFCEGIQGAQNPYFIKQGFKPAKGEALIVKIPGARFNKMYKNKVFLVHLSDDIYWCGGGYEWNSLDDLPTAEGRENLINELKRILDAPFEIIEHKAAIRPTVNRRMPILKEHDYIHNMYMLNGLGTKGASIAPLATRKIMKYILNKNKEDLLF